jgi:hypothetical protein
VVERLLPKQDIVGSNPITRSDKKIVISFEMAISFFEKENIMLKKIFTNTYVIVGIVVFILLLAILLWSQVSLGDALMASLALALIGVGAEWWRRYIW